MNLAVTCDKQILLKQYWSKKKNRVILILENQKKHCLT